MEVTTVVAPAVGAVLGYVYYRLIGCRSGVCPLTSNPVGSSVLGAVVGLLISGSLG